MWLIKKILRCVTEDFYGETIKMKIGEITKTTIKTNRVARWLQVVQFFFGLPKFYAVGPVGGVHFVVGKYFGNHYV